MSAKISLLCSFFATILFYDAIDCISASTSRRAASTLSARDQQSSTTATLSSHTAPNHNSSTTPPWLKDALKDIAYYLRAHKFNEYDRRYETQSEKAPRQYFQGFPRPPLRSLHWEVHKNCPDSFLDCVKVYIFCIMSVKGGTQVVN